MKWIILRHKVLMAVLGAAVFFALIAFVNHPAFVGASGNARQLPIYCVEKDYKVCSLSFDAAWADACVRALQEKACKAPHRPSGHGGAGGFGLS